jgi:hypothetical protein
MYFHVIDGYRLESDSLLITTLRLASMCFQFVMILTGRTPQHDHEFRAIEWQGSGQFTVR